MLAARWMRPAPRALAAALPSSSTCRQARGEHTELPAMIKSLRQGVQRQASSVGLAGRYSVGASPSTPVFLMSSCIPAAPESFHSCAMKGGRAGERKSGFSSTAARCVAALVCTLGEGETCVYAHDGLGGVANPHRLVLPALSQHCEGKRLHTRDHVVHLLALGRRAIHLVMRPAHCCGRTSLAAVQLGSRLHDEVALSEALECGDAPFDDA